jgi:hypothetical protein
MKRLDMSALRAVSGGVFAGKTANSVPLPFAKPFDPHQ